ncbi:MAG TPA: GNAT family N-acetyltransferase [Burkholderiales bacterium]|nr:GNAT family N-acetyltransferase [Burkholderiales bacterium]
MSVTAAVRARFSVSLRGAFGDTGLDDAWAEALRSAATRTVFQEKGWQQCWWDAYGRGDLVIVVCRAPARPPVIAPLFIDGGMAFFVGSGGSDYLDFIGDAAAAGVLAAILGAVRERYPDLIGFRFYHVPDTSRTAEALRRAAQSLALVCHEEESLVAPALDLARGGAAAVRKQSLVRHERYFRREGDLEVVHMRTAADIEPLLPAFFVQHVERWADTPTPSLFCDAVHRSFYERLARASDALDWIRFTLLRWNARPIAFHFGFSRDGAYLWYKPAFDRSLARRSPGEVLLRQLLLAAMEEDAHTFDFGIGDEGFKARFATRVTVVRNWGVYDPRLCR